VGRRRLKITQVSELDGYRVASAELIKDDVITANQQDDAPAGQQDGEGGSNGGRRGSNGSSGGGNGSNDVAALSAEVLSAGDELLSKLRNMLASRRMAAGHIRDLFDRSELFGGGDFKTGGCRCCVCRHGEYMGTCKLCVWGGGGKGCGT
jgi:hypothetical protein